MTEKLQHVTQILQTLKEEAKERKLSPTERQKTLETLKVYGRDPRNCDPLFTTEGIETLGKHGFDVNADDVPSAREALRCLANALLVVPRTRQMFVNAGLEFKAAEKLKGAVVDDQFLLARILFLITYDTTYNTGEADLMKLVEEKNIEASIDEAIAGHAERCSSSSKFPAPSAMDDMALEEVLKLIFNFTHYIKDAKNGLFVKSVPKMFTILQHKDLSPFPLRPPITNLINALLNIDLTKCQDSDFPPELRLISTEKLIEVLDKSIDPQFTKLGAKTAENFDDHGKPLITLLHKVIQTADKGVVDKLKVRLLPSIDERNQPLGKGTSLPARLLQLTTSASTPNTRESISWLLFELSGNDAAEFINNIGYGYASGFLVTHNIPIPASSFDKSSGTRPVNPITGQTLDSEPPVDDPFDGMTQEEKEREAERLFVLFERLKKTGVVDVKNPVETAFHEGRFQEIPDDEEEDSDYEEVQGKGKEKEKAK
ncbi:guanine nucleotide exchange factor [Pyronema omphalodes]|nr:guanine nucleotide exchange factor [Pyronema omphalodes]